MREKIIENWLSNSSERGFQIPFALSLIFKGYKVIHISRHCAMELGKDILAVDSNGILHAYQLKAKKKIKLNDWRNEISKQVFDLVNLNIKHPSAKSYKEWHKSYLVVNGELEEEVIEAITKFNEGQESAYPSQDRKINIIVFGQLYEDLLSMDLNLWPSELEDDLLLLDLFLSNGLDVPPIEKIVKILSSLYKLERNTNKKNDLIRLVSAGNLLISLIANTYVREANHYSEYLCWGIQLNFINFLLEKSLLKIKDIVESHKLVLSSIENSLENHYDEIKASESFLQGNPISDVYIIKTRRLISLGLCAYRNIFKNYYNDLWLDEELSRSLKNNSIEICGESAFVYLIPIIKYYKSKKKDKEIKEICTLMMDYILHLDEIKAPIANPYYSIEHCLLSKYGSPNHQYKESFLGKSYFIESFIRIMVSYNEIEYLSARWNKITKIMWCKFYFDSTPENFLFRTKSGKTLLKQIDFPTSFKKLKNDYLIHTENSIPKINDTLNLINLLLTYPHRSDHDKIDYILNN